MADEYFKRGQSDVLDRLNNLRLLLQAANSVTNPTFYGASISTSLNIGSAGVMGACLINGDLVKGAATLVQNAGAAVIGIGNKSALVGGNYSPTPYIYAAADIESNVGLILNRTLAIQNVAGALQLKNDAAYLTFFNSAGNQYSGFMQGFIGSSFDVIAGAGHQLRMGAGGAIQMRIDTSGNFSPVVDGVKLMGLPEYRWAGFYASTGAVQTSDARKKTPVSALTPAMRAAAREMLPLIGTYQWLDAVNEKGEEKARLHIGFTVQQAIAILEKHGIDPLRLAFICYDKWDDQYEKQQTNVGKKVTKLRIVQRQKTRIVKQPQDVVELIDGKPVLLRKIVEVAEPVFDEMPVMREDGSPAMLDENTPMMHRVPVMEGVQEPYEAEAAPEYEDVLVRKAGDCYAFRYDQLTLFMLSALAE